MCFTQEMSAFLSTAGTLMSFVLYSRGDTMAANCILYFTAMEILQCVQYSFIADTPYSEGCVLVNKVLTSVGFLHICFQPYVNTLLHEYGIQSKHTSELFHQRFVVMKRLCIVGGSMLLYRHLYTLYDETYTTKSELPSTEWLRHDKLCTYHGKYHLAWAVPMMDVSYYVPSTNIHFFLMFIPMATCYEKKALLVAMACLYVSGPLLASFITPNLMEQASIWCFLSMFQCSFIFARCLLIQRRKLE
jgi:hypothetical protein